MKYVVRVLCKGMIERLTSTSEITWTNVTEPSPEELVEVVRQADLSPYDAEFVAQPRQRPEVVAREKYLIILVHVPTFDRNSRVTTGAPMYLIVTKQEVVSIQHQQAVVISKAWQEYDESEEKREEYFGESGLSLALHLLQVSYRSSFQKLERLSKHVAIAEDAVFQGNERQMVEEVSVLMRDVMDFRKIILPQLNVFATPPDHDLVTAPLRDQWRRLHNQAQTLWDILEGLVESTIELRNTNDSLIAHKESELLRLLTYYSTITIPVFILLSPINPLDPNTSTLNVSIFWIVLAALLITLLAIFYRFRGRKVI